MYKNRRSKLMKIRCIENIFVQIFKKTHPVEGFCGRVGSVLKTLICASMEVTLKSPNFFSSVNSTPGSGFSNYKYNQYFSGDF